ncbi:hypothetical protein MVEN_01324600 [Mycena venus]|uniref:von Willebrand domain-containing protein n=1 Tax=Mycena venus TaxID=2733690 RepID=A0A8H7CU05_9AGAR|nr:hypothetical protein MVEN_01324600 [Mycena venus]
MHGLYYSYERRVVSLPLLGIRAEASLKELAAQVKLTQTYLNDASVPIQAKYSFPIPARAAVSSFAMIKQDGTQVIASVLEKFEARETYNTAVSRGQQAALMEQQTSDVFQVAVGNIPSNERVQIELVYSTELSEDEENDSVRFHLPVHIGTRYGQAPFIAFAASPPVPFLTICATVEAHSPISKIGSPSHTILTEFGPNPALPNFEDLPFSNYARVSLSSDSALDRDFVLTVKSAGLDAPRCVAEHHPINNTTALALTFVPRFTLPDLARQEFILIVDRSGSMEGLKIAAARRALVVLLRALPHKDTLFQLVSFGSHANSLWPGGSRPYNQRTLEEATHHVDTMHADCGGTEIHNALKHAFASRARDRPTSVLMLTDGAAWDIKGVMDEVKAAVRQAPENAPLRVSVLGIGNGVSTALCEGMARVGHGTCMLVGEQETSFVGKIARLLKGAKTPTISNITVDWGRLPIEAAEASRSEDDFVMVEEAKEVEPNAQNQTPDVFDEKEDPTLLDETPPPPAPSVILPPPAAVQQSPFKIRNLFPGTRVDVYAILQGQDVPRTVTLRGSTPDGAEIALPIAVALSRLPHAPGTPPALHALAARKIIQDLEDGQHTVFQSLADPADTDLLARTVRAHIVRLGTTYQIASTHTSFVAVDEVQLARPQHAVQIDVNGDESDQDYGEEECEEGGGRGPVSGSTSLAIDPRPLPAVPAEGPCPSQSVIHDFDLHTLDNLGLEPTAPFDKPRGIVNNSLRPSIRPKPRPPPKYTETTVRIPGDALEAFARMQAFDGAFPSPLAVLSLIAVDLRPGITLDDVQRALPAGAPDALVGTTLALAFLAARMRGGISNANLFHKLSENEVAVADENTEEHDAWAAMYEKAREWVEAALREIDAPETVESVEAEVGKMLTRKIKIKVLRMFLLAVVVLQREVIVDQISSSQPPPCWGSLQSLS